MATNTSTSSMPSWALPAAKGLLNRGVSLSNQAFTPYDGQRIANFDPLQTQGFGLTQNRALGGSAEENAARTNYTDVMSGKNLDPNSNPYLKGMVSSAMDQVQGRVNSQFGGNNYGTTAHQETLQRGLSDTANNIYGQAYQQGLNQQTQYASMLPTYGNLDYQNAQQLIGLGDINQNRTQQGLDIKFNDWQQGQNQSYKNLDVLSSALNGATRGQGTMTSGAGSSNSIAGGVGGALAGYGIGNTLGGYGGYGAALGGLLGYFGS